MADSPFVSQAATHIIAAGGKRFRPTLVFVCSRFGGDVDEEDLIKAALVMELTHVASLYHDDVMDEADIRRGAPSANAMWGNAVAILVGDYLFTRASTTVNELGRDFVDLQARTFTRLVQGQIAETIGPGDNDDPLEHYLQVIADKTGSLIAASARFGGMVAGASEEILDALSAFGEDLGAVFQLSDDLIDITSTTTGKTPGIDLREGIATLPTLMLAASTDPADAELRAKITGDLSSDEALAEALAELRAHPVMDKARAEVRRRAESARRHLEVLPDGDAKELLLQQCNDLVDRTT
ncbi:polyprenyl synthetase family protein [Tessaracoccus sp. OS52]|uniref:polyprenyl synthetase family protein n=1 Tax=Tessaracoccus sp. OS52 TaxID=2886691 RepID=UPI00351D56F2